MLLVAKRCVNGWHLFPYRVFRYGAPGVEFMGLHDENAAVTQVHFLPNQVCFFIFNPAASEFARSFFAIKFGLNFQSFMRSPNNFGRG